VALAGWEHGGAAGRDKFMEGAVVGNIVVLLEGSGRELLDEGLRRQCWKRSMRDTEGVALDGREFDEGIVNGIELEGYRGGRELDKLDSGGQWQTQWWGCIRAN